jgi:IS30 family transposase
MKPVKPRRRFTETEDAQLEKLRVAGLSLAQIANQMVRARSSIQMRLVTLAKYDDDDDERFPI